MRAASGHETSVSKRVRVHLDTKTYVSKRVRVHLDTRIHVISLEDVQTRQQRTTARGKETELEKSGALS